MLELLERDAGRGPLPSLRAGRDKRDAALQELLEPPPATPAPKKALQDLLSPGQASPCAWCV